MPRGAAGLARRRRRGRWRCGGALHLLLQYLAPAFEQQPAYPPLALELIERELGRPAQSVFADLDERTAPIAAASLGQVYRCTLRDGGREVAVEVDGPSHFVGRTPTGATALKRRQLRAAGWALLSVPYWEWNALGQALGSKTAKQAYLQRALANLS